MFPAPRAASTRTLALILALIASPVAISQPYFATPQHAASKVLTVDHSTLITRGDSLLGKTVELTTCAMIPMTDHPRDDERNMVVLYPCGADIADDAIDSQVIPAFLTEKTKVKQSPGAQFGETAKFKGKFRGVVQRRTMDGEKHKRVVILLDALEFISSVDR